MIAALRSRWVEALLEDLTFADPSEQPPGDYACENKQRIRS